MKLIYLAHPLSGDINANLERAKRWFKWVIEFFPEVTPLADWILWCQVVSDDDPVYRQRGIAADIATVQRCDEIWLFGGALSQGMQAEVEAARAVGKPVVSFLHLGSEPLTERMVGLIWAKPGQPPQALTSTPKDGRVQLEIGDCQKECYETAKEHGWWEDKTPNVPEKLALIHSEISEALEEYRSGNMATRLDNGKPEGFGIELADAVIRIMDLCAHLGIDLGAALRIKMDYNKTRPYRHGSKKC